MRELAEGFVDSGSLFGEFVGYGGGGFGAELIECEPNSCLILMVSQLCENICNLFHWIWLGVINFYLLYLFFVSLQVL